MNKIFISLVLLFLVVGGLVVFQATRTTYSSVLLPSELIERGHDKPLPRVRVGGRVSDPIVYTVDPTIVLKFNVQDPPSKEASNKNSSAPINTVPVIYNGLRPDMFAVGRDVIIEGEFVNGSLQAAKLLTQCPSKYEAPAPDKMTYKSE